MIIFSKFFHQIQIDSIRIIIMLMMITNRFVYCLLEIDSIDMCMYVCKSSNDKQIEIEEEEKKN